MQMFGQQQLQEAKLIERQINQRQQNLIQTGYKYNNQMKATRQRYIMFNKQLQQTRPLKMKSKKKQNLSQKYLSTNGSSQAAFSFSKTIDLKISTKSKSKQPISDVIPRYESLFMGNVLDGQNDYKQYLMQTIEQIIKKQIKQTKLLFRYDPFNPKANIHLYIDNHPNILFVAKTSNLYHLASFSEESVNPNCIGDGRGMIISLTNRRFYQLHANKKSLKYDKLYLIFGNSEIRVSGGEKKVFSNFGINNSHFDAMGDRVDALLGEGNSKEAELDCFEVHQLIFGSKKKE